MCPKNGARVASIRPGRRYLRESSAQYPLRSACPGKKAPQLGAARAVRTFGCFAKREPCVREESRCSLGGKGPRSGDGPCLSVKVFARVLPATGRSAKRSHHSSSPQGPSGEGWRQWYFFLLWFAIGSVSRNTKSGGGRQRVSTAAQPCRAKNRHGRHRVALPRARLNKSAQRQGRKKGGGKGRSPEGPELATSSAPTGDLVTPGG